MLDRMLAVKVARAFELNPWVARVKWVRKSYPGQVEVELEYRRPVAMVEVYTDDEMGLFPIDSHAVLLDPRDYRREIVSYCQTREVPKGYLYTVTGMRDVGKRSGWYFRCWWAWR